MAYSEELAQRIRTLLKKRTGLVEKKMFGGVGFLLYGNMACGITQNHLVIRVGPDNYQSFLALPHVKEFDITGRPMRGWVMVSLAGYETDQDLTFWVEQAVQFSRTLPAK